MSTRAKSRLKIILDEREISIRKCAELAGLKFETVRKMYNDEAKQYQRDTLGALCKALDCDISDLLELIEE
ncbi:helix-turn-helix domain-containing protein [Lysinibacillus sp. NPDC056232]|uniref:helix-turn-helix domain-containing protein n=1 Tax=Lysinibacillus sp. NPDC056232 TaxID=3345756 RepID=UPI0035DDB118